MIFGKINEAKYQQNTTQPGVLHGIVFRLAPHNPVNFSFGV